MPTFAKLKKLSVFFWNKKYCSFPYPNLCFYASKTFKYLTLLNFQSFPQNPLQHTELNDTTPEKY